MNEIVAAILSALIVGVFSLVGIIITAKASQNKMQIELEKNQAVTNTKMDMLTREVREHNDFARRIPTIEAKLEFFNKRLNELEEK